ncbi:MAG: hypothetical protein K5931_06005 [Lachnospiraceae bacterium]|nr:hypothetical protein [Lachnospiraceae bacterium]
MKELITDLIGVVEQYKSCFKIIVLFLAALLSIVMINTAKDEDSRVSPAVFVLSIFTGISYSFGLIVERARGGFYKVLTAILLLIAICLSGKRVLSIEFYSPLEGPSGFSFYYILFSALALFIIFSLLSLIAGYVIFVRSRHMDKSLITLYSQGMAAILSIFCICNGICSLLGAEIRFTGALWLSMILLLELLFMYKDTRLFPVFIKELRGDIKKGLKQEPAVYLLILLVLALMLFQIGYITGHEPVGEVEMDTALLAFETGHIIGHSPMMMLYAWLSMLLKIHPYALVNKVMPIVLIPMYYGLEWSLFGRLSKNIKSRLYMMLAFGMLQIFGYYSEGLLPFTLLMSYYRGLTFIIYGLLPLILWFVIDKKQKEEVRVDEAYLKEEEEDMKNHKIVNARTLGIALIVFFVIFTGVVYVLNNKINSLYETTVALQSSSSKGVDMREYPLGGEESCYILVKTGSVDVLGGVSSEDMEGLYKYLTELTDRVDRWYISRGNENDEASYNFCREKGLKVEKAFYMELEEYKGK